MLRPLFRFLAPANSIPGFHALEFTAAARFEYYLNNDTNVLVPKFGMRWQPFDDSLTLRSTWGEGFREPSLYELFGSPSSDIRRARSSMFLCSINSNPALDPEDSRDFTAGIVYTPKFIPGLTVSVDIYDIERKESFSCRASTKFSLENEQALCSPVRSVLRDPNYPDRILR